MTLDQILELATRMARPPGAGTTPAMARQLARAVLDLLGEAQPCTMEPPTIVPFKDDTWGVDVNPGADPYSPSETRAYCAMVLRQADEAEAAPLRVA